jgi:hypothetical protein
MCVSVDFRNPNGYAAEMDPDKTGDDLYNLLTDNFDSRSRVTLSICSIRIIHEMMIDIKAIVLHMEYSYMPSRG